MSRSLYCIEQSGLLNIKWFRWYQRGNNLIRKSLQGEKSTFPENPDKHKMKPEDERWEDELYDGGIMTHCDALFSRLYTLMHIKTQTDTQSFFFYWFMCIALQVQAVQMPSVCWCLDSIVHHISALCDALCHHTMFLCACTWLYMSLPVSSPLVCTVVSILLHWAAHRGRTVPGIWIWEVERRRWRRKGQVHRRALEKTGSWPKEAEFDFKDWEETRELNEEESSKQQRGWQEGGEKGTAWEHEGNVCVEKTSAHAFLVNGCF